MNSLTICSVGDLMMCDSPLYASVGIWSRYDELRGGMFSGVEEKLNGADITIGNFESVVYRPKNRSLSEIQMCCSSDVLSDLASAGFNYLHIANNHILQHGTRGFESTLEACRAAGIVPLGKKNSNPYRIRCHGIDVALFALCIHKEWYLPEEILYEDDIRETLHSVRRLRADSRDTLIIVSVHWGDEFATSPSNAQVSLGHALIDFGANIILGHHPHVYQGIEQYHGGLIAYSQGNFVSDMVPELCRETAILEISADRQDDSFDIRYSFLPVGMNRDHALERRDSDWITARQTELKETLTGSVSTSDYWKMIARNHGVCHGAFRTFFLSHMFEYRPWISLRMLTDFVIRKISKAIGASSFGQRGSMDEEINRALDAEFEARSRETLVK